MSADIKLVLQDQTSSVLTINVSDRGPAGQDGADSTVPGPAGQDGADGMNGQDGADADLTAYLTPQTLNDSASITYDASSGVNAIVTITADRTLGAITNATSGQSGTLTIVQGGAGGWTLTLDASQTDLLDTLADIASLGAGEEAEIAWRTNDGINFKLWITA